MREPFDNTFIVFLLFLILFTISDNLFTDIVSGIGLGFLSVVIIFDWIIGDKKKQTKIKGEEE